MERTTIAQPTGTPAPASRNGASGLALEPASYLDPAILEREQERIFERTWQLAGHVSQLPAAGQLPDDAGRRRSPSSSCATTTASVRAYRNVCRHRGSRLLSGSGQCKRAIRCRYHGWTYRLDGTLIGMPEARSFGKVDKAQFGLFPVRAEVLCGLDLRQPRPARRRRSPSSSATCRSASRPTGSSG